MVKDDRKSVYVRNLPFRATEEDLDGFFSQVGRVVDVRRGANSEGVFLRLPQGLRKSVNVVWLRMAITTQQCAEG